MNMARFEVRFQILGELLSKPHVPQFSSIEYSVEYLKANGLPIESTFVMVESTPPQGWNPRNDEDAIARMRLEQERERTLASQFQQMRQAVDATPLPVGAYERAVREREREALEAARARNASYERYVRERAERISRNRSRGRQAVTRVLED